MVGSFHCSASTATATSTTASPFGAKSPEAPPVSQQAGSNMFGSKAADSTSLSFASFGLAATPASSAATSPPTGNIFASAANKPVQNIFGGANNSGSSPGTASVFGGSSPQSNSTAFGSSIFANASNTSTNVFGGAGGGNATVTSSK